MLYNDAVKNVFLILVSLAFMSVAQAGPFGLKNGMTVDEIIEAGFKRDWDKYDSITGRNWSGGVGNLFHPNLKRGIEAYPEPEEGYWHLQSLINDKHPNMVFGFYISKSYGLMNFNINIHGKNKKNLTNDDLDKKFSLYKEALEKKYKTVFKKRNEYIDKITTNFSRCDLDSPVNEISSIYLSTTKSELLPKNRGDTRTHEVYLTLGYGFVSYQAHLKDMKSKDELKQKEKIKELSPKEEDL